MSQSSLMAWLKKPTPVTEVLHDRQSSGKTSASHNEAALPTPPQSDHAQQFEPKDPTNTLNPGAESLIFKNGQPLPPNVQLRACTKDDIPSLKRLIGVLLPIPYPERFYREIMVDEVTNNITLLAFWHDEGPATGSSNSGRLVGAIRCRLLAHPLAHASPIPKDSSPMLYLSTLVLLSPYRRHGIAAHMLSLLTRRAVEDYGVGSVGAHVWEANTEGLEWYSKRGFSEVGREADYYRRLKPSGAVVLKRDVSVMDLVGSGIRRV